MNIADKAIKDIKKPFCMDSLLVAVILLVTLSLVTTVANTNILSYFNYPVPISRILIVISLLSNFFITFPLLAIIIMDEQIQQQIYLHAAAYFGKHDIAFIGDSIIKGGHVWAT